MTDPTLVEQIKGLSPGALGIFKKQLVSLPENEKQQAFSRLAGIPELSDIMGSSYSAPMETQQPVQATQQSDIPLWKRALSTATSPFRWISENVTEPFGTIVTSPFTPSTSGTQGMNWMQRERAEYKAWDDPTFHIGPLGIGVKGVVETLPWLAVPSAAGILGKAGMAGAKGAGLLGLAEGSGSLARGAALASKIVKPLATAERIATYPISKPLEMATKAIGEKLGQRAISKVSCSIEEFAQKVRQEAGIPIDLVNKSWRDSKFSIRYKQPYMIVGIEDIPKGVDKNNFLKIVSLHELGHKLGAIRKVGIDAEEEAWKFVVANADRYGVNLTGITKEISQLHPEYGAAAILERFIKPTTVEKIVKTHNIEGGATFDLAGKNLAGENVFVVGAYPNRSMVIKGAKVTKEQIEDFAFKNGDLVSRPRHTIGTWFDKETGNTVLDVSVTRGSQEEAMKLAQEQGQKAIFNLKTMEEIPVVGGTTPIGQKVEGVAGKLGASTIGQKLVTFAKRLYTEEKGFVKPAEFTRFWESISGKLGEKAETIRQKALTSARSKQAERVTARLSKIEPEKLTQDEYNRIWREESSQLLKETPMGFPEEFKESGFSHIREVLSTQGASEFEIKSTITAFENALAGKGVPRVVGIKGGSAYTRLEKVFGSDIATDLASPTKLKRIVEELNYKTPQGVSTPLGEFPKPEALKLAAQPALMETAWTPKPIEGKNTWTLDELKLELANKPIPFDETVTNYLRSLPAEEAGKKLVLLPESTRSAVWDKLKTVVKTSPDALNILRSTLSSGDISAIARQGAIAFATHPIAGFQNSYKALKTILNPKYATDIDHLITTDPDILLHLRPGLKNPLYIAPPIERVTTLGVKEEAYMSNLATRLPILEPIVKASGRNFVTFLNLMRYHMVKDFKKGWIERLEKTGQKVTDIDYSEMNRLINVSTGRGDLKLLGADFNRYGGLLNTVFFSPRLLFSRFQWPAMVLSPSKTVRVEAWKQIGSFLGAGGTALAGLKLSGGGDIGIDPRSSDFGKLRIGDTSLDVWTGYAQYARMLAQLVTAQRTTESGLPQKISRWEVIDRFARSKYSPALGLFRDIMQGQSFIGEEFTATPAGLGKQIYERAFPMAVQDMVDGFMQSGVEGFGFSTPSLLGVGIVNYMDETSKVQDKVAKEKYGMSWDAVGKVYGQAVQLKLEQTVPKLIEAEKKRDEKYATFSLTASSQFFKEGEAIEDTYRKTVTLASQEYRETGDGVTFRNKVSEAATTRRQMYSSRENRADYKDISDYYNQPLSPDQIAKMNPGDVQRREYNQLMYGSDMYDNYGNYLFDEAEKREQDFLTKYGQSALNYIEEYSGSRWVDKPPELVALEKAKDTLRPYWQLEDKIWSMYPEGLKTLSDQIKIMEQNNPVMAKQVLKRYPQILRARELVARYKQTLRNQNPLIGQAYQMYY